MCVLHHTSPVWPGSSGTNTRAIASNLPGYPHVTPQTIALEVSICSQWNAPSQLDYWRLYLSWDYLVMCQSQCSTSMLVKRWLDWLRWANLLSFTSARQTNQRRRMDTWRAGSCACKHIACWPSDSLLVSARSSATCGQTDRPTGELTCSFQSLLLEFMHVRADKQTSFDCEQAHNLTPVNSSRGNVIKLVWPVSNSVCP